MMVTIRTDYVIHNNPELKDKDLPAVIFRALSMPVHKFIERTLDKVSKAIDEKYDKDLYVRCYKADKPGEGFCFKTGGGSMPDVVLGFCGDVEDFELTLMHELLHLFRWDEKMIESKAKEIYEEA